MHTLNTERAQARVRSLLDAAAREFPGRPHAAGAWLHQPMADLACLSPASAAFLSEAGLRLALHQLDALSTASADATRPSR
jgi:hypothetical protein